MTAPLEPPEIRNGRAPLITLRLTQSDRARLKAIAAEEGRSVSELTRDALNRYFEQREQREASAG